MEDRSSPVDVLGSSLNAGSSATDTFLLRRALLGDLSAIAGLEKIAFTDPWSPAEFRALLDAPHIIFLVAVGVREGSVVGYAVVSSVLDQAEILNLAVAPACRGVGAGGMLLDAGMSTAVAAGAKAFFLEVRESNAAARGLYASRNFSEISRRRGYYKRPVEDALVLRGAVQ